MARRDDTEETRRAAAAALLALAENAAFWDEQIDRIGRTFAEIRLPIESIMQGLAEANAMMQATLAAFREQPPALWEAATSLTALARSVEMDEEARAAWAQARADAPLECVDVNATGYVM